MELRRSAHVDTFCRDHLPPPDQWPDLLFDLPGAALPRAAELRRRPARRRRSPTPGRPALPAAPGGHLDVRRPAARGDQVAHVLADDLGVVPGNRVLLRGPNNPLAGGLLAGGAQGRRASRSPRCRCCGAGELRTDRRHRAVTVALCDHRFIADLAAPRRTCRCVRVRRRQRRRPGAPRGGARAHVRRRATPRPTTSRCSRSPPAPPAAPKATMHFHRDVLADRRHLLRARARSRSADDVFTGTPPLGFHLRARRRCWSSRCGPARSTLLVEKATPAELAGRRPGTG